MVAACTKFVICENVPSNTLSQLTAVLHTWFRFGRSTRYFQSCGRIDKGSVGQKYPVFLPKRNQECKIALSFDKVQLGEVFIGSGSSYLTFSKITNFIHAATTEFKFYVIMKWVIVHNTRSFWRIDLTFEEKFQVCDPVAGRHKVQSAKKLRFLFKHEINHAKRPCVVTHRYQCRFWPLQSHDISRFERSSKYRRRERNLRNSTYFCNNY